MARVLVLDDNAVNRELIHQILEPFGYEVTSFGTVAEALAHTREIHPDLILSDLYLPDESGYDFLYAVRHDDELRSIPFILMTSFYRHNQETALALGATDFVYRPIEPEALLEVVRKTLSGGGDRAKDFDC